MMITIRTGTLRNNGFVSAENRKVEKKGMDMNREGREKRKTKNADNREGERHKDSRGLEGDGINKEDATKSKWLRDFIGYHKAGLQLLKIVHKVDRSAIPLRMINSILEVAGAYLNLYLTARLIDTLLTGRFKEGFFWGCAAVLTGLLVGTAARLVEKAYARSSQRCTLAFAVMMREKAGMLDYETMEQPQVSDKIFTSERLAGMYGGLGIVVERYQGLLSGLLEIGTAVGLILALCFRRPAHGGSFLTFGANPIVSLALVLLFLGLTIFMRIRCSRGMVRNTGKYLQKHVGMEMQLSYMGERVMMNLQGAKVIRIYDMKKMLLNNMEKWQKISLEFYGDMCNTEIDGALHEELINGFFTVFSYLFVAVKVLAGAITIGAFTQYSGAMLKLSGGFQNVTWYNTQIKLINSYMSDFLDLMKMENSHAVGTIPVEKRLDGEYEIEFRDVSFRYPGSEEMILKHVNCKINMKDKLALVGENGAGKTTFVKLLCRLYEPTEGVITLNGIDIRKYREEEYRELFGVVFQDFKLFAFPLWQNLVTAYERDDARVRDCLVRAGAAEFVEKLSDGTNTLLFKDREGGVDISGGEAQKLALARALYKDAPFVVLDEPTAALDPVSEAQVYAGFHEMVKDKTSIYISHRMSSCRFCDDIVVFCKGRIVERGSHEELLERQGHYAGLWYAQAKYYVKEEG